MKARRKLVRKPKAARPEPTRDETRRFASRVSRWLVSIGAVIALVIVANRWVGREGVREIRIVGRTILDSAEVVASAAIPEGSSLQRLDLDALERRLTAHPFIARAAAYRGENGTLVIEIAERAPVAVAFVDGVPQYLDSSGVRLPYRFSSAGFDVPVLSGVTLASAPSHAGAQVSEKLDSVRTLEALAVASALRSYDDRLFRQISEIRREPVGQYTLVTADGGVPVRAGAPADVARRLRKLDLFLATAFNAEGASRAEYIDLRWDGEVVVRWRGALRAAAPVEKENAHEETGKAGGGTPAPADDATDGASTGARARTPGAGRSET